MNTHEQKVELIKKYYSKIERENSPTSFHINGDFFFEGTIPQDRLSNAILIIANHNVDESSILGYYDTSINHNGTRGYLFTDERVYFRENISSEILEYADIKSVEVIQGHRSNYNYEFTLGPWLKVRSNVSLAQSEEEPTGLRFNLYDGTYIDWDNFKGNVEPLYDLWAELLELSSAYDNKDREESEGTNDYTSETATKNTYSIKQNESLNDTGTIPGIETGNFRTVNKLFDEERFNASQGHGFAAERANDLADRVKGRDAGILGDDNAKNGPDRYVNGVEIQSKYCASGTDSINACFEGHGSGMFRYYTQDGTPMQIEVPSDQYDAAISAMEKKIINGQVEGVTDPKEAKNIVRKGNVTYAQAKNIAKAGTIESLTYDAVNGVIISASALGVTAMVTLASSIWNGDDFDVALKAATYSGLRVGGTSFVSSVLASQLSKAGLNSALVSSSEAIVEFMGPKASAVLVNAFRSGSNIYGAAAMKSAAKLLRGNAITAGATVVVLSTFDIANIFRGRISGKQLFKNLAGTTSTVAAGTAGFAAGAAIGSFVPIIGNVVGGLIGSLIAGAAANTITDSVLDAFIEDDADEMVRIIEKQFTKLAEDYLLNQKEAENVVNRLQDRLDGNKLKDMYASSNRKKFADNMIIPLIEDETSKRKKITVPTEKQMSNSIRAVLEEISDDMTKEGIVYS